MKLFFIKLNINMVNGYGMVNVKLTKCVGMYYI